jgi:uncharacterized membrane protein
MSEALVILFALAVWFVAITRAALAWWLVRERSSPEEVELEELRAPLARGEVSREEYERACDRPVPR